MKLALMVLCLFLSLATGPVVAEPRSGGEGDTSRHSTRERTPPTLDRGYRDRVSERERWSGPRDPAVEHFWSDRCVDQRRWGRSHSGDCDNPAYTGGRSVPGPYLDYWGSSVYDRPGYVQPRAPYRSGRGGRLVIPRSEAWPRR